MCTATFLPTCSVFYSEVLGNGDLQSISRAVSLNMFSKTSKKWSAAENRSVRVKVLADFEELTVVVEAATFSKNAFSGVSQTVR
jgi:hypothetical protein